MTSVVESEILPLTVDLRIGLNFEGAEVYHQAVAFERIRFLINTVLHDSIICSRINPRFPEIKAATSTPIIELWDEPWDQFIGIMLFYKIDAIIEKSGFVEFVEVSGDQINPDMEWNITPEDVYVEGQLMMSDTDLLYMKERGLDSIWYHRSDTSINEDELTEELTWEQLGLTWNKPDNQLKVTGGDNIKKFTPRIVT